VARLEKVISGKPELTSIPICQPSCLTEVWNIFKMKALVGNQGLTAPRVPKAFAAPGLLVIFIQYCIWYCVICEGMTQRSRVSFLLNRKHHYFSGTSGSLFSGSLSHAVRRSPTSRVDAMTLNHPFMRNP